MPSDKPPRLNIQVTAKLHSALQRASQAREQSVSEITRQALRREIVRKDFSNTTHHTRPREEDK